MWVVAAAAAHTGGVETTLYFCTIFLPSFCTLVLLAYRAVNIFTTAAEGPAQAALKKPKASKAELHGVQAELR